MDTSGHSALPLLLSHAQPAAVAPVSYCYNRDLDVNVMIDADGNILPVVEGKHGGLLTKTVSVQGEE
jgi:hypothetical protein